MRSLLASQRASSGCDGDHSLSPRFSMRLAAWLTASRLIGVLAQAVSLLLLHRWTTAPEFVAYASVIGAAAFVGAVTDLGSTQLALRERPSSPSLITAMRLSLICAFLAGLLLVGAFALALGPEAWLLANLPLLLSERRAETSTSAAIHQSYRWRLIAGQSLRRLIPLLVLLVGQGLAANTDARLWFVGGAILGNYTAIALGPRVRLLAAKGASVWPTLQTTLAYALNSAGQQLRQFDVTILAAFGTPSAAASYALPARLLQPLRIPLTSVAQVVFSKLVREPEYLSTQRAKVAVVLSAYPTCVTASVVLFWIIKPEILGQSFPPLIVLCLSLFPSGLVSLLTSGLQALSSPWRVALANTTVWLVWLVFISLLADHLSGLDAAVSVAVTLIVQAVTLLILWRSK